MKNKTKKQSRGKHFLKRIIRIVLLTCLLIIVGGFLFYNKMIFPGCNSYKDDSEILKVKTDDGNTLSAYYLHDPNAKYTILFSHGNGEDLGDDMRPYLNKLYRRGFSVFAWDYRGYGTSSGSTTVENTCEDIVKIYDYLIHELNTPPESIVAMGRSVGGGPTTYLAARKPLAGVILESTFVTAFRVMTKIPLIPFDKFKNIDEIKNIHCPLLIIHGKQDKIVPFWHGEKLFENANQPKYNYWVNDAGHNDLEYQAGRDYWDKISSFVEGISKEQ